MFVISRQQKVTPNRTSHFYEVFNFKGIKKSRPPYGCSFLAVCHAFCVPPSSSLQLFCVFSPCSRSLVQKLKTQPLLTLGSPANSLGSVLSQFLSRRTKHLARKSKTPPKPQRKRHCRLRFLILRQLPPSGLGRTRRRLASTVSANRSFLTFCSHFPHASSRLPAYR